VKRKQIKETTHTFSLHHPHNVHFEVLCLQTWCFTKPTKDRHYLSSDDGVLFPGKPFQKTADGWWVIFKIERQTPLHVHQQLSDIHI